MLNVKVSFRDWLFDKGKKQGSIVLVVVLEMTQLLEHTDVSEQSYPCCDAVHNSTVNLSTQVIRKLKV